MDTDPAIVLREQLVTQEETFLSFEVIPQKQLESWQVEFVMKLYFEEFRQRFSQLQELTQSQEHIRRVPPEEMFIRGLNPHYAICLAVKNPFDLQAFQEWLMRL